MKRFRPEANWTCLSTATLQWPMILRQRSRIVFSNYYPQAPLEYILRLTLVFFPSFSVVVVCIT